MSSSKNIASWLVLGPIFNDPDDRHYGAGDIINRIEKNLNPIELTTSIEKAPKGATTVIYGDGEIFNSRSYTWRPLSFSGVDWGNVSDVEDDIHQKLGAGQITSDPQDPQSFTGKHHALVFFLVHIKSPSPRTATLFVESDDSIRVWLNGREIDSLRYVGDRDVTKETKECSAEINLQEGSNILLVAVAETYVEWAFSARIADADGLVFSTEPSECSCRGKFLDGCHIDLPPGDVVEEVRYERFFKIKNTFGEVMESTELDMTWIENEYLKDNPAAKNPEEFTTALYYPFNQQWELKGYTRGRLVKSFSLSPGEEQTIELFTWDRLKSQVESTTSYESEQLVENTGTRRDALDVLQEVSRQSGFQMTNSATVGFKVNNLVDVNLNSTANGNTVLNEAEKTTRNTVVEATSKSSNKVRTSRTVKVTESRESGSEERVTRKLRNPNAFHTLNIPFFEILVNYRVTTSIRLDTSGDPDVRLVVLVPSSSLTTLDKFTQETLRVHETTLRLALLDRELEDGFAAARLLDARNSSCKILCQGCKCGDVPVIGSRAWRYLAQAAKDAALAAKEILSWQGLSQDRLEAAAVFVVRSDIRVLFENTLPGPPIVLGNVVDPGGG